MRPGVACLVAVVLLACDGPGVAGPTSRGVARVGSVAPATALAGDWRRSTVMVDAGVARSTETTWRLGADGSAQRITRVVDLATGAAEVTTAAGRWQLAGDQLRIDLATPVTSLLTFTLVLRDLEIVLSGVPYQRVPG